jgi:hypothetical protein
MSPNEVQKGACTLAALHASWPSAAAAAVDFVLWLETSGTASNSSTQFGVCLVQCWFSVLKNYGCHAELHSVKVNGDRKFRSKNSEISYRPLQSTSVFFLIL